MPNFPWPESWHFSGTTQPMPYDLFVSYSRRDNTDGRVCKLILGFSGNSTDRPHASTVEVLSVVGPMAGSGTLVAVKAQYV